MFLDASALAAVLLQEPEGPALLKAMEAARGHLRTSPVARVETVLALVRNRVERRGKGPATAVDYTDAALQVAALFEVLDVREMHITTSMGEEAIRALSIYGKQVGHAAQLNLGDALSYVCAKAFHVPLLYKGNGFSQTDLA